MCPTLLSNSVVSNALDGSQLKIFLSKNQMETKNCSHKPRQYSMLWISQSDCIKKTPLPYKWHLHCDVVQGLASQQLHLASWHPIYPTSCSHPALAPFIQTPWVIHPIFIQDRKVGVIKPENQVFGAKFTRLACLLKALRVYFGKKWVPTCLQPRSFWFLTKLKSLCSVRCIKYTCCSSVGVALTAGPFRASLDRLLLIIIIIMLIIIIRIRITKIISKTMQTETRFSQPPGGNHVTSRAYQICNGCLGCGVLNQSYSCSMSTESEILSGVTKKYLANNAIWILKRLSAMGNLISHTMGHSWY